jgi:hypothetical protein
LKVVAKANLGGLGAAEGAPVVYSWTLPSLMPLALPWLGLLGLLALRPNRCGRAWWILLPVGLWSGLGLGLQALTGPAITPWEPLETVLPLLAAGAFGFAGVLLLGYLLARQPWPIVFLGMCAAQTGVGLIALLASSDADSIPAQVGLLVVLGVCSFGLTLALSLASLVCRRRYGAFKLTAWLLGWLLAGWLVLALPFCLIAALADGSLPWPAALLGGAAVGGTSFVLAAPFLILCFANPFYRDRFLTMLGLRGSTQEPPPIPPVSPAPQAA